MRNEIDGLPVKILGKVVEMRRKLYLIGHNVAVYAPHFYSNRQIQELPVQIIGKVVELRRKF